MERVAMGAVLATRDTRRKVDGGGTCREMEKVAMGAVLTVRGGIGQGQRAQGDGEGSDGGRSPPEEAGRQRGTKEA
jgi:hypothetical protein